jgi:hypothetical protein
MDVTGEIKLVVKVRRGFVAVAVRGRPAKIPDMRPVAIAIIGIARSVGSFFEIIRAASMTNVTMISMEGSIFSTFHPVI